MTTPEDSPLDQIPFAIYSEQQLRQEELTSTLDPSLQRLEDLEKEFVEGGYRVNPDMTVDTGKVDLDAIKEDRHKLVDFRSQLPDLISQDTPGGAAVLEAYLERTAHDIAITRLVVAGVNKAWPAFRANNERVFGPIGKDVDAGVKDWFAYQAAQALTDKRVDVRAAAGRVLDVLGSENGTRRLVIPSAQVFNATRRAAYEPGGYMHEIFDGREHVDIPSGTITEQNGDAILERMLYNTGSNTVLQPGRYWAYHPETNVLERPEHYELSDQEFVEYWSHEFLHMKEGVAGRNGPLLLASTGLARYSLGNEGSAIIPEQIANETFQDFAEERRWQMVLARHLAVSLGSGFHGQQKSLSSVELYAVLKDIFFVYEASRRDVDSLEKSAELAHKQAWGLTEVVKAGTDGSRESGVVAWPLPYAGGNVRAWKLEAGDPGAFSREAVGKIDRSNHDHRRIMTTVGALTLPSKKNIQ